MGLKIKIDDGQLSRAFINANTNLKSIQVFPATIKEFIDLFEKTYNITFINVGPFWEECFLLFKSEADYFAFLMRWS